jgi:hypothetical protein
MGINLTNLYIDETFPKLVQTSGSVFTDGTGSLLTEVDITASNSVSSSYALTASYALNSVPQVSSSYAVSASHALNADNSISSSYAVTAVSSSFSNVSISASYATTADTSISSSYALTASYALNSQTIDTGSFATTGSNNFTGNQNITGSVTATSLRVENNTHLDGALRVVNDTTMTGDLLIQSTSPKLRLRDTSGGGHSSGYDLTIDTGSFIINDETHDRPVLSDIYNDISGKHTTELTSEIIVISGSDSVTILGPLTASLQEGYAWVGNLSGVTQQVPTSSFGGGGGSFPYTGSAIISGSLTLETLNNPGFTIVNPTTPSNYIQIAPEDGNLYTKNVFNMGAEKNFFQSPGELYFNTSWDAGSSGSINFISPSNINIEADSEIVSRVGQVSLDVNNFGIFAQKIGSGSINTSFNSFNGNSQPTLFFNGVNSYFQATNNMYFENAPGGVGSGSMQFRSNGNVEFITPNYGAGVDGGSFLFEANSGSIDLVTGGDINVKGKAFAYSISSNINGFSNQVNEPTFVRDNQRAFVETPLVIGFSGTIEVGTNSTLKVINEL